MFVSEVFGNLCSGCVAPELIEICVSRFKSEVFGGQCPRCEVSEFLLCLCPKVRAEVFKGLFLFRLSDL